ncbi:hypothetical protein ACFWDQ_15330 [Streptomyces sp. NPDC060053]
MIGTGGFEWRDFLSWWSGEWADAWHAEESAGAPDERLRRAL